MESYNIFLELLILSWGIFGPSSKNTCSNYYPPWPMTLSIGQNHRIIYCLSKSRQMMVWATSSPMELVTLLVVHGTDIYHEPAGNQTLIWQLRLLAPGTDNWHSHSRLLLRLPPGGALLLTLFSQLHAIFVIIHQLSHLGNQKQAICSFCPF